MVSYGQLRKLSTVGEHFLQFNSVGVDGKNLFIYYVFETIYDEHEKYSFIQSTRYLYTKYSHLFI